ncbi:hypothetical protein [Streptomyces sp. AP-93]|uniref:hypothetical protein n=1 Tax=Streptomyces sp. AP-93 TaxID=2929048 RepID=UPI001FAF4CD4|nr:hypothetical protein [Streptomyces sp. AP-93]MCJ0867977.1 hypothetical protein [Streptomyces sp. AP-93]
MTRPTLRTQRPAVRWPRLLLFAALLLGIAGMHTLGHPTPAHAMEDVPSVRFVPRGGHPPSGEAHGGRPADAPDLTGRSHTVASPDTAAAAVAAVATTVTTTTTAATFEAPRPQHSGMDPMSVCLAVLGALTLLVLGAGLAGPRRAAPLGGAARAPGRSGGPDPPPPRELLTLLTVLRV